MDFDVFLFNVYKTHSPKSFLIITVLIKIYSLKSGVIILKPNLPSSSILATFFHIFYSSFGGELEGNVYVHSCYGFDQFQTNSSNLKRVDNRNIWKHIGFSNFLKIPHIMFEMVPNAHIWLYVSVYVSN